MIFYIVEFFMTLRQRRRRVGRPSLSEGGIDPGSILDAAHALLLEGGLAAVTLRALARRLGVDAMAPYHHFDDKDAILVALAERIYAGLEVDLRAPGHRERLRSLATAYVALLVDELGELTPYLARAEPRALGPERRFDQLFRRAVEPLALSPKRLAVAQHAFVDFLHGFALARRAGDPAMKRALSAELGVFMAGIEAMAGSPS